MVSTSHRASEEPAKQLQRLAGTISTILLILIWAVLSYGNIISRLILPTPSAVLTSFVMLWQEHDLCLNFLASLGRVLVGMGLAVITCFFLSILMGTSATAKAFLVPITSQNRYLPVAALVPLFIVWFGIEELMKIMLLFVGTTFYLLPLMVNSVETVDKVFVEAAYTLKARRADVIRFVIVPAALPEMLEKMRVVSALGWTYLIIAEMINAKYGLGQLIYTASKYSRTDQVFAVLIVILLIGIGWDKGLKWLHNRVFFWKKAI